MTLSSSLLSLAVCIACVNIRYTKHRDEEKVSSSETFIQPDLITNGNAANFTPDLSPNGGYILYSSDRSGNKDIWEKKISEGYSRQLTNHKADDLSPVMSPDGKSFAFVSRRQDAAGDIHIMDLASIFLDENDEEDSSSFDLKETEDTQPAWFKDGERIVFTSRYPHETEARIMIGNVNDYKASRISGIKGSHPTPSPDGKWISYSRNSSIYLYQLDQKKEIKLTSGKYARDGQPSFSQDGKFLYFIRYVDDTNRDGQLNGDDRPSIWKIDLIKWRDQDPISPLAAIQISSSKYSSYYPKNYPPYVYFTMQTQDSLDIFRIPEQGHIPKSIAQNKVDLLHPTESSNMFDISYYYRVRSHRLYENQDLDQLKNYLVQQLAWLVQEGRSPEANFVFNQIIATFPEEKSLRLLSEILLIKLKIQPISYPDYRKDPVSQIKSIFKDTQDAIKHILNESNPNHIYHNDIRAVATIINTRLRGTHRDFFEALTSLQSTFESITTKPYIEAESQLLIADLITDVMDKDTAITKLVQVIKNHQEQPTIVKKASYKILDVIRKNEKNKLEKLARIRDQYASLPWLPPIAHQAIVDNYIVSDKKDVARNELREMIYRYDDTPEIAVEAARDLISLAASNEASTLENELDTLYKRLKKSGHQAYAKQALKIVLKFRLRKAAYYLKNAQYELALEQFRSITSIDKLNINGHRGIITTLTKQGKREEIQEIYSDLYDKHPKSAEYLYLKVYAQSFEIDFAKSPSEKVSWIDDLIEEAELARRMNGKILRIHQTLGWLYYQKHIWRNAYFKRGGFFSGLTKSFHITKNYFGATEPIWIEMSIDSYLTAQFLTEQDSIERAEISQNLGESYFEMGNYKQSLKYYVRRVRQDQILPFPSKESKAIVTHNAGRAALQIGQLDVAINMLNASIESWEALGNDKEIARNLDFLGLALQEANLFELAEETYKRLAKVHHRLKNHANRAIALINQGYANFKSEHLEEALRNFHLAGELLSEKGLSITHSKPEGIRYKVPGKDVSEKLGFTVLTRKIQIETYKAIIHERTGRLSEALEAWRQKKDLQIHKQAEGHDLGRDDLYYTEEIATTFSNIGRLEYQSRHYKQAQSAYWDATQWAQKLRDSTTNIPTELEWTNLINHARSRIQERLGGNLSDKDLKKTINAINTFYNFITNLPSPLPAKMQHAITQLAVINQQLAELNNSDPKTTLSLSETLSQFQEEDLSPEVMLALNLPSPDKDHNIPTKNQISTLRKEVSSDSHRSWRYLFAKGLWLDVYQRLINTTPFNETERDDKAQNLVTNENDLNIFDHLLDYAYEIQKSNSSDEQLFQLIANHSSSRSYFLATLINDHDKETLLEIIKPKPIDEILESLDEDEILIYLYQSDYSGMTAFILYEGDIYKSEIEDLQSLKIFIQDQSSEFSHAYIVSNKTSHNFSWQEILPKKSTFSYIMTPSSLPYMKEELVPEAISIHEIGDRIIKEIPPKSVIEFHHGDLREKVFSYANFIHISQPTYLDEQNASFTKIKSEEDQPRGDDMVIKNLALDGQERVKGFVYGNLRRSPSKEGSTSTRPYRSFQMLHLISLMNGAFSTVMTGTDIPSSADWAELYLNLKGRAVNQFANAKKMTVFGLTGKSLEVEEEDLEETINEAIDEESFRTALYYARIANKSELIPKIIVNLRQQSLEENEKKSALYFQEKNLAFIEEKNDTDYADELKFAALAAIQVKEFEKAVTYLTEAITIYKEEEDFGEDGAGEATRLLAIAYERLKDYSKSLDVYKEAKKYFDMDEDSVGAAKILLSIGNQYSLHSNDYAKAISYYEQAAEIFDEEDEETYLTKVAIDKANAFIVIGQTGEAIKILKEILAKKGQDSNQWIRTAQILTKAYYRTGQNQEARTINERVLSKIEEMTGTHKTVYFLDANMIKALILAKEGDYERALDTAKEGIKLARENKLMAKLSQSLNNIGFIYREYGLLRDSVAAMEEALEIDRSLKSDSAIAFDLRNLGLGVALLGDIGQAKEYLENALKMSQDLKLNYNATFSNFSLGDIALIEGKYKKAITHFSQSLETASKGFLSEFRWKSLAAIGRSYDLLDKTTSAQEYYVKAINLIESLKAGQKVEPSKTGLLSDMGTREVYNYYASLVQSQGNAEDSWNTSERSRARVLIDTIASQKIEFSTDEQNAAMARERELRNQMELIERALYSQGSKKEDANELSERLQEKRNQYKSHISKMGELNPQLPSFVQVTKPNLSAIQEAIPDESAMLSYFVTKDHIILWLIKKNEFKSHRIKINQQVLTRKVLALRSLLEVYSTTDFVAKELSELLLDPVLNDIQDSKKVIIVPHSILNHLSFALLPINDKLLIDHASLSYLDSSSSLIRLADHTKAFTKNSRVLALGYPAVKAESIPFSAKEVTSIKRYFSKTRTFIGKKATLENLFSHQKNQDIIHIASHGTFDAINPINSKIYLTPTNHMDGQMDVRKFFKMGLSANLVTLSACESGMGALSSGEEVISLNKAMFYNGTQSIISTLWRINDVSSAIIMKRFYRYLSEGESKDDALRKSQLLVRQYFPHPSYWAPYRLTGRI